MPLDLPFIHTCQCAVHGPTDGTLAPQRRDACWHACTTPRRNTGGMRGAAPHDTTPCCLLRAHLICRGHILGAPFVAFHADGRQRLPRVVLGVSGPSLAALRSASRESRVRTWQDGERVCTRAGAAAGPCMLRVLHAVRAACLVMHRRRVLPCHCRMFPSDSMPRVTCRAQRVAGTARGTARPRWRAWAESGMGRAPVSASPRKQRPGGKRRRRRGRAVWDAPL